MKSLQALAILTVATTTLGTINATNITCNGTTTSARISIPTNAHTRPLDVAVSFPAPPDIGGDITFTAPATFTVE